MRESMIFYKSFAEAIECLDEKDQLTAFWDIVNYALNGTEPDGTGAAIAVFKMAKPQIDINIKRYENGTKGGRPKTKQEPNNNQSKTKAKPKQENEEPNYNYNLNDNYIKENNLKVVKEKRFVPPTVDEVKQYAAETGKAIDAERFVDFYASKNWMVGKNKMKDWKAAVRNWIRQDRQGMTTKTKTTENFPQRNYDFGELNKQWFGGEKNANSS